MPDATAPDSAGPRRLAALGLLAVLLLVPVTLPVAVLRGLVQERFAVSELATSLFMSVNMVGAVLAAPVAGAIADRTGRLRGLVVAAVLADAACFLALTAPVPFAVFLGVRFLEGCAHIFALSLVLAAAVAGTPGLERGRRMGLVGAGITLGVALGAPLGGALGGRDPLLPLKVGAALLVATSALAWVALPAAAPERSRFSVRELVRALASERALLLPLAFAFVDRFTVGFFTSTFPLYLSGVHGAGPGRIGFLLALFLFPFALCSYPFGRLAQRGSLVALVCGGSAVYGLLAVSLGWWDPRWLGGLMVALGVSSAVMFVPSIALTSELAPQGTRATALGGFNAAGSIGFLLGPIAGGAVSQGVAAAVGDWHAGYRAAFVVAGTSEILCVALALPWLLRLSRAGRVR